MNGRDLGRAWRTDDGGGPSSKHRLTVIQLFVIAWDSSSIRAARSSAPSNTIRSSPGPSVMVREDPPPATPHIVRRHLTARTVEVSGFDTLQQCKNFFKSMKPGGLGGHGGAPTLLYVRERSGIMACLGAVLAADPDVSTQLRHLAVEENSTVQQLLAEALDLLFQARGKPVIARERRPR